ncbi:MAG: VTT domain-containing protein [Gammaproteobacteria bacterium]
MDYLHHLDHLLIQVVTENQAWTYIILPLIFFAETGIIPMAFLPGDSLLLALGAFAATVPHVLNVHLLFLILTIATILGKTLNYFVGMWLGPVFFSSKETWLFHINHLEKAEKLYERWGGKILIIGCFIPVLRTFSPCIAGIARMKFRDFCFYNFIGAIVWIGSLLYCGFLFGNIPIIQQHLMLVIICILIFSIFLRPIIEWSGRKWFAKK